MRLLAALSVLALSSPVFAGQADADACAAQLGPAAQIIYKDSAPSVTKDTDIVILLREHTTQLVKDGKISHEDAKPAAHAAGGCIKELMK